jgi:RNA polymerase sigma-70 factor, ECF subfamily
MALEAKLPDIETREAEKSEGHLGASILAGLERQDAWASAALFDRLEAVVERALYRVLQQRGNDFEDLVQITFERIVRTLVERRFSAQCSLTTWAAAIATNVAIDSVRARVRERRIFAAESIDMADHELSTRAAVADRLEVRAEVLRLQTVLAQMNPGQAEAVFLHDVMGHDLSEVAIIAGVTIAAAQSRLVRGRREFLRRAKRNSVNRQDDGGQVS